MDELKRFHFGGYTIVCPNFQCLDLEAVVGTDPTAKYWNRLKFFSLKIIIKMVKMLECR